MLRRQVSFFVDMEQCDRFLLQYFTTINDVYPQCVVDDSADFVQLIDVNVACSDTATR